MTIISKVGHGPTSLKMKNNTTMKSIYHTIDGFSLSSVDFVLVMYTLTVIVAILHIINTVYNSINCYNFETVWFDILVSFSEVKCFPLLFTERWLKKD